MFLQEFSMTGDLPAQQLLTWRKRRARVVAEASAKVEEAYQDYLKERNEHS